MDTEVYWQFVSTRDKKRYVEEQLAKMCLQDWERKEYEQLNEQYEKELIELRAKVMEQVNQNW